MSELYIAHHGILGQKWGKRNGPPYPLGASDHSAAEKKAGWKKSLDSDGPTMSKAERKAEKYKQKQIAKIHKKYDKKIAWARDIATAQKEYSTQKEAEKPDSKRLKKKNAQVENELDYNAEVLERMRDEELKAVMNMSVKDVKSEKNAVALNFGKNIAKGVIADAVFGKDSKAADYVYKATRRSADNVRTGRRLTGKNKRFSEPRYRDQYYKETRGGRYKYNAADYAAKSAERNKKYAYAIK